MRAARAQVVNRAILAMSKVIRLGRKFQLARSVSMVLRLEKQLQHFRPARNLEFLYECVLATLSNRLSLRAEDQFVTEETLRGCSGCGTELVQSQLMISYPK